MRQKKTRNIHHEEQSWRFVLATIFLWVSSEMQQASAASKRLARSVYGAPSISGSWISLVSSTPAMLSLSASTGASLATLAPANT